jgi:hypothetical protein
MQIDSAKQQATLVDSREQYMQTNGLYGVSVDQGSRVLPCCKV